MKNSYGDCIYCRGDVAPRVGQLDYRWRGQLFLIENVSFGQCSQCGERFLTSEMTRRLEQLALTARAPYTTVAVPVLTA